MRKISLGELFKIDKIYTTRVTCVFDTKTSETNRNVIYLDLSDGEKLYYLGDVIVHRAEKQHEYENLGQMILELKDKINTQVTLLKFEFFEFKTGDKFEIDADEISLEKHREEMKKKTVINPPEEIMDLELKSIMESIQWMERVKNDSTSAESIKLAETTLKALKKQIPEKPLIEPWSPALCKDCGEELSDHLNDDYYAHQYSRTVCDCGKKIYWGR